MEQKSKNSRILYGKLPFILKCLPHTLAFYHFLSLTL
jgi:hypothetical protein